MNFERAIKQALNDVAKERQTSESLPVSAEYGFTVTGLSDIDVDRLFRENGNPPVIALAVSKRSTVAVIARLDWLNLFKEKLIQAGINAVLVGQPIGHTWGTNSLYELIGSDYDASKYRFTITSGSLPGILQGINEAIHMEAKLPLRKYRVRVFVPIHTTNTRDEVVREVIPATYEAPKLRLETCPECGDPLVKAGETEFPVCDLQGNEQQTILCENPKCYNVSRYVIGDKNASSTA